MHTADFLFKNKAAFVTSTPRTGKTLSVLLAIDRVLRRELVISQRSKALIVAPLTVADGGEWAKTLDTVFPHIKYAFLHGEDKLDMLADPTVQLYLMNPDGLRNGDIRDALLQRRLVCLVVDELTEFASVGTQRSKYAKKIADLVRSIGGWVWGLTGTPGNCDKIYGQVYLINPSRLLNDIPTMSNPSRKCHINSYYAWRNLTQYKYNAFAWQPIPQVADYYSREAMQPCLRYDKADILEIPAPEVIKRNVPMTEEQKTVAAELTKKLKFCSPEAGAAVEVLRASTLATKLLQVAGGVVIGGDVEGESDEIELLYLDNSTMLEALQQELRETPRKKIVFANFRGIIDRLVAQLRETTSYKVEKIDGSTSSTNRRKILADFSKYDEDSPHILVCHPRVASYGIELSAADKIIIFGGLSCGSFVYQQLFERISSSKQTAERTSVVHLICGEANRIATSRLESGVEKEIALYKLFLRYL